MQQTSEDALYWCLATRSRRVIILAFGERSLRNSYAIGCVKPFLQEEKHSSLVPCAWSRSIYGRGARSRRTLTVAVVLIHGWFLAARPSRSVAIDQLKLQVEHNNDARRSLIPGIVWPTSESMAIVQIRSYVSIAICVLVGERRPPHHCDSVRQAILACLHLHLV